MPIDIQAQFEVIKWEQQGDFVILSVNRPDKLNALNHQVLSELKLFLSELKAQKGIKGMIFTGEGDRAFIAGADIKQMSNMTVDEALVFGELGQQVTFLFESLNFPVIAAVHGHALGGGCEMAMAADFIYATEQAVFGQPEVKLGLIPGFGGTQRLARLIGRNRAKELIYTGRTLNAAKALEWGLVTTLFSTKQAMLEAAKETLELVAKNGPLAIGLAKKVMNSGNDLALDQALQHELNQFASVFGSLEMREGTSAFIEKRSAKF